MIFDQAPRVDWVCTDSYDETPRRDAERLARMALARQPKVNGRKAVTSRTVAEETGLTELEALGALCRLVETRKDIRKYMPAGRLATFYTGPVYKPIDGWGKRKPAAA